MAYREETSIINVDLTYPAMRARSVAARHRRTIQYQKWKTAGILLLVLLGVYVLRRLG